MIPVSPDSTLTARQQEPAIGCRRGRALLLALAALLCAAGSGCNSMHRRMTIYSDPPGALVLLEGEEIGYTPVSVDFTYYGTREISLVKDGYETLSVMQKVPRPWYQYLPIEFVTDNLSPVPIRDQRDFTYKLRPQVIVPSEELLNRAGGLRSEAQIPQ